LVEFFLLRKKKKFNGPWTTQLKITSFILKSHPILSNIWNQILKWKDQIQWLNIAVLWEKIGWFDINEEDDDMGTNYELTICIY
jgi:hypothetical protein